MKLIIGFFMSLNVFAESGPGNGTDYVKILFSEAQYTLLSQVSATNAGEIEKLKIDAGIKNWLLSEGRWASIKHYLRAIDLRYQQVPCTDFTLKPASICFFYDADKNPYVLISLLENKMTTKSQAMAMLIHEAGHFTGETDHSFLDRVGVELVAALQTPSLFIVDAQNTETVGAPFIAKEQCDAGTSGQAQVLKKQVLLDLSIQCGERRISCDLQKTQFVFQGTANSKPGVGFDMTVTCKVRAVLIF